MKFEFKPADFGDWDEMINVTHAALAANTKFNEWRRSWVRVYGEFDAVKGEALMATGPDYIDTHQAYLVEIEELPNKAECEHQSIISYHTEGKIPAEAKCLNCGVKLKAKWEAAE